MEYVPPSDERIINPLFLSMIDKDYTYLKLVIIFGNS